MLKALKLLFRSNDQICVGNEYAVEVGPQPIEPLAPFFSVNPLHPSLDHIKLPDGAIKANKAPSGRRADLNVTSFNNFLFEMDGTPLETQLEYIEACGFPFATVTYSGGKSYHAILSLEKSPVTAKPHTQEAVDEYKRVWKALAAVMCQRLNQPLTLLDSACQNPSRLSRMPGATRDNGKVQELVRLGRLCSMEEFMSIMQEAPEIKVSQRLVRTDQKARSEEEMKLLIPAALLSKLKFPKTWASGTSSGNYQNLLRIVLWMIDATGADKATVTSYMEKYTFPYLLNTGYSLEKCYKPINDAFAMKGDT